MCVYPVGCMRVTKRGPRGGRGKGKAVEGRAAVRQRKKGDGVLTCVEAKFVMQNTTFLSVMLVCWCEAYLYKL